MTTQHDERAASIKELTDAWNYHQSVNPDAKRVAAAINRVAALLAADSRAGGEVVACIPLTKAEVQSGMDRVKWAEGLIRQLPEDHDGRNSWLLNYSGSKREDWSQIYTRPAPAEPQAVVVPKKWREFLERLEWSGWKYDRYGEGQARCPDCGNPKEDGHYEGCELKAMLSASPAAPAAAQEDWRTPTSYLYRFHQAMTILCQAEPPLEMVEAWLDKTKDDHRLQEFAIEHAPHWAQGIAIIDAAYALADQPTEILTADGPQVDHERQTEAAPAEREPMDAEIIDALRDGLSVCQSVSTGWDREVVREGCTLYLQTEEWCNWLEREVAPKIERAIEAAHHIGKPNDLCIACKSEGRCMKRIAVCFANGTAQRLQAQPKDQT